MSFSACAPHFSESPVSLSETPWALLKCPLPDLLTLIASCLLHRTWASSLEGVLNLV